MTKTFLFAAALASISGCSSSPTRTAEEVSVAVGPPPKVADVKRAIIERFSFTLKDPSSVTQFDLTAYPIPVTWSRGLLRGRGVQSGWLACYQYNAKNSYGGYTGLSSEAAVVMTINGSAFVVPDVNWATIDNRCY